ncbi:MAG: flagellar hook protein FlgE [Burkholderiaceae bacterium]
MSFQQGLSGLNASSKNLEVIGNNIANANTFGTKTSRAEFADLYANALSGTGVSAIGIGVNLSTVAQQFTQGNVTTTENPMDLAINGKGFFQLTEGSGAVVYSRNGQFKIDRDGFIVNNQGFNLQGYPADAAGVILPGLASALQMPVSGLTPRPTTRMDLEFNLDARSSIPAAAATPNIDITDPDTYNNATTMTVYDAKGQDVAITYYFQKTATDNWNVYITANGTPLIDDGSGNPALNTTITFPANGSTPTAPVGTVALDIPATTNAQGAVTEPIPGVALDLSAARQFGASFSVAALGQDGYAAGQLVGVHVEGNGIVMAEYSNGQSKPAGQVELATFRNPQGLQPSGGNNWSRTFASGEPVAGVPGSGTLGVLQAGALEESNVDLTAELVNMITAQRIYQANAQTIKSQDQILQTLVNLR